MEVNHSMVETQKSTSKTSISSRRVVSSVAHWTVDVQIWHHCKKRNLTAVSLYIAKGREWKREL